MNIPLAVLQTLKTGEDLERFEGSSLEQTATNEVNGNLERNLFCLFKRSEWITSCLLYTSRCV